jgi:ABC-type proline/glycine betaine transport system permease subunit
MMIEDLLTHGFEAGLVLVLLGLALDAITKARRR